MRARSRYGFLGMFAMLGMMGGDEPTEIGKNIAEIDGIKKRPYQKKNLIADVKGYRCYDRTEKPRVLFEIEKPFHLNPVIRTFSRKGRITTTPKCNFSITRN